MTGTPFEQVMDKAAEGLRAKLAAAEAMAAALEEFHGAAFRDDKGECALCDSLAAWREASGAVPESTESPTERDTGAGDSAGQPSTEEAQ